MTYNSNCPIWKTSANMYQGGSPRFLEKIYSPRAGGWYQIDDDVKELFFSEGDPDKGHKARLTTWLVEQRPLSNESPEVTWDIIKKTETSKGMRASERADRVLGGKDTSVPITLAERTQTLGTSVPITLHPCGESQEGDISSEVKTCLELLAHSESIGWDDLTFLFQYLKTMGLIEQRSGRYVSEHPSRLSGPRVQEITITVPGFERVAELEQVKNAASDQVFVAMSFDPSLDTAWKKGIEPAVEVAGYKPLRVDKEEYVGWIPDKIISEIRKSRFVVADFSHGKNGASEGVYFEAGFAYGLDLDIILTCKDSDANDVHFDLSQYNCIHWKNPEDLREKLGDRIGAIIGYRSQH